MLFKKIRLLFFSLNLFLFATAQSTVHFKTIDAKTTKPLESVTISISKLKLVKITNDSGYTFFNNIPGGVYDIEFSETGYEKEELQLKLPISFTDTTITVSLKSEEKRLQQVTVISTRSNNRITDEPKRVEILSQEEVNEELNMLDSSWILQTGFRIDKHNRYDIYLLPRFSLLFKATKHLSLRGGYGRGYNIPSALYSVSGQDDFQNVYPLQNNVIPEIAGSWNADILYKSRLSEEWNISFDEAFYFTTVHHPVIPEPDSLSVGKYYFINASLPVKAKGLETNIRLASDDLEFLIGYAHLDVRKKYDPLQPIWSSPQKINFSFPLFMSWKIIFVAAQN